MIVRIPHQLSFRPVPLVSESVVGYWIRMALANRIPFSAFMRSFPPKINQQESVAEPQTQLSSWAGQLIRFPAKINPRWILANNVRWCPICLTESEHWRPNWELAMVSTCPIHNIQLYDRCPACNTSIYYWGLNFSQCACGARITSKKRIIPAEVSKIEGVILSALYPSQFSYAPIQQSIELGQLSIDQLHQFMLFVGSKGQTNRKPHYKTDITWSLSAANQVNQLLSDWPQSYFGLLDAQLRAHPNESVLSRQFGYYYRAIFKEFKATEFAFLRNATEKYLSEQWPGILDQRHRNCSDEAILNNRNLSQTKISKILNASARNIRRWLRDKKLAGQLFALRSGRTRATVQSSEFEKIAVLNKYVYLYQAAIALGLPERRIIELIEGGIIYGSAPKAGESWLIPVSEIKKIRYKLNALSFSNGSHNTTWDYIFRYQMSKNITFSSIVLAVLSGKIQIVLRAGREKINTFEDFLVEADSFKKWLGSGVEGWTLPSLESRLGIKQEVIYHLANKGLLKTSIHGRLGRRVSNDEVQRFILQYVTGAEVAKQWKISPRAVEAKLVCFGIHPISGPRIDGGRQNIFLRADINQYSP